MSKQDAARFLMQATLGYDQTLLDEVANIGPGTWLSAQLGDIPAVQRPFEPATRALWLSFKERLTKAHGEAAINGDGNNPALPYKWYFRMAWWQHLLTRRDDLLRQRVAQALSEILVVSDASSLELNSIGMASYYDLLYDHAFGSYADLLTEVSLHPMMGIYLTHINNQKADPVRNIHPDENYAREIMQLFTIGLFELNPDGSEKLDASDKPIPTYDNRDIKEMARVFTGILPSAYHYEWVTSWWDDSYNGSAVSFTDGVETAYKTVPFIEATKPMIIDESYHDRGAKSLLKGRLTLPGDQDGPEEIQSAVAQMVAHPSTAPFVARHLINRLVTSNPSPDYIEHVVGAFGPKGDLRATVEAILTWPLEKEVAEQRLPSARPEGSKHVQSQKLKSPLHRVTQLLLAFNAHNSSGKPWLLGDDLEATLAMHPMAAPTVFNFYKPGFAPHGDLQEMGLKAPEFQLHTSATSVAYVNLTYQWFMEADLPLVSTQIGQGDEQRMVMEMYPPTLRRRYADILRFDFKDQVEMAKDANQLEALIAQMLILLTGHVDSDLQARITTACTPIADRPKRVVQTIAFMIAVSPEFTVQEA